MAFGHSILAMSGEETLAQVNREIQHPKLKNLKRAAIVIAIYSLIFTGGATLLASMLIDVYKRQRVALLLRQCPASAGECEANLELAGQR